MWLATYSRCWTADRLAKRGMDHPERCPLCDQEDETIQHILTSCSFSKTVWFQTLSKVSLQEHTPGQADTVLQEWWEKVEAATPGYKRAGFNTIVLLVSWWLWKHRNACVFDHMVPSVERIAQDIANDAVLWCQAGAKGLRAVWP